MTMDYGSTQERFKRGAGDAGRYFRYMADFVGFRPEDAAAIRETRFVIEKHIPAIVANFYTNLLRFANTRRFFLGKDGRIDQEYLELRMRHQTHFWRRAASGDYDDDFARYVDYVGRAHTSQGADPKIDIPERYVIGMVGYVQKSIAEALIAELHELDPDLEVRGVKAWNALMVVILEMLSRSYEKAPEAETIGSRGEIDDQAVYQLAVDSYERSLGIARSIEYEEVAVATVDELPEGERVIVQVADLTIGVFHHKGGWYALHNSCLHRGGPVCAGERDGDILTCPWHGYQYNLTNGELLLDPSARLPMYPVILRDGQVYLQIPHYVRDVHEIHLEVDSPQSPPQPSLAENEFRTQELKPGQVKRVFVDGRAVAVYNLGGVYYATQDACTHADGPLSEGELRGEQIICPWHASAFDVTNGQVLAGPAGTALQTYQVVVEGEVARVQAS